MESDLTLISQKCKQLISIGIQFKEYTLQSVKTLYTMAKTEKLRTVVNERTLMFGEQNYLTCNYNILLTYLTRLKFYPEHWSMDYVGRVLKQFPAEHFIFQRVPTILNDYGAKKKITENTPYFTFTKEITASCPILTIYEPHMTVFEEATTYAYWISSHLTHIKTLEFLVKETDKMANLLIKNVIASTYLSNHVLVFHETMFDEKLKCNMNHWVLKRNEI